MSLTILMLTANRVPEKWAEYHKQVLLEAADGQPIITVSRKPRDLSLLDTEKRGISNIYFQMLRAARIATTQFVGIAEDDTLYPPGHFQFNPPLDSFAYNINRFNLFTWSTPRYHWKDRYSNSTLIAPRELLIEALGERFTKWPNGTPTGITGELGRRNIEDRLGTKHYKTVEFATEYSVIRIDHEQGVDNLSKSHRKGYGIHQAYDIPHWGTAKGIISKFK